ncbi:MAG: argininosuccinate lyase [Chloroflexota bacterium]|nr:argininosuccinate lyase [Chloroflexota bacterium]
MIMTLWGGAFALPPDESLRRLNDSFSFDRRMYAQDIDGSIAYARALARAGVLTGDETDAIVRGLEQVQREFDTGAFVVQPGDEDIHTAVERRLTELIGAAGGKLHTGRSRNDQVVTDFRLWTMEALKRVDGAVAALQHSLIDKAEAHVDTLMPGYTHFQPAQPITMAHWLLSYFWMLARDRERLQECWRRVAVSPLGSGALAGHPFGIDRETLAHELGFISCSQNSLDAVSDRDFAVEATFALTLMSAHISRFGEDMVLFTNPAFGYFTLDDRYSTGSSIMPQKRNADPMELTRGKAARLIGRLTGLLAMVKGTMTGYNKDYQEDKEATFEAFDTLELLLPVVAATIDTMAVNELRLRAALSDELLATDLAEYLVRKGLPFRQAHHVVGKIVREAQEEGVTLSALPLEGLQAISPLFSDDVRHVFSFERSVAARDVTGGSAPDAVRRQIAAARETMQQPQAK